MNGRKREAVILSLIQSLRDNDSCTKDHVEKLIYFLQELMKVPMGLVFIFYKHSPVSFDLRDVISSMESDMILISIPNEPYAPNLDLGTTSDQILENYSNTIEQYKREIEYVSNTLYFINFFELEHLATALYVKNNKKHDGTVEKQVNILTGLNPHITKEQAKKAFEIIERIKSVAAKQNRGKLMTKNTTPLETEEQAAFVNYLNAKNIRHHATPNGMFLGKGGAKFAYMAKMKKEGLSPGFPDLTIFVKNKRHNCLYIEMKRQKGGKLSPEQKDWIDFLDKRGDCVAVAKGCEAAIRILNKFIKGGY